jgi:hypothetical protein
MHNSWLWPWDCDAASLSKGNVKTTAAGTALVFQPNPSQFYGSGDKRF